MKTYKLFNKAIETFFTIGSTDFTKTNLQEVLEETDARLGALEGGGSSSNYIEVNSDFTLSGNSIIDADTSSNEIRMKILEGSATSFVVSDSNKKFNSNSFFVDVMNADGVTVDHTLELDKKNKTWVVYFNGSFWAYREEGRGQINLVASVHVASEDFPLEDDYIVDNVLIKTNDFTHTDISHYLVDTKENDDKVTIKILQGTRTSFTVSDYEKNFDDEECMIEIMASNGTSIEHDLKLDKKDRTYHFFFDDDASVWRYKEEGKGEYKSISSSHVASEDFPHETLLGNNVRTSEDPDNPERIISETFNLETEEWEEAETVVDKVTIGDMEMTKYGDYSAIKIADNYFIHPSIKLDENNYLGSSCKVIIPNVNEADAVIQPFGTDEFTGNSLVFHVAGSSDNVTHDFIGLSGSTVPDRAVNLFVYKGYKTEAEILNGLTAATAKAGRKSLGKIHKSNISKNKFSAGNVFTINLKDKLGFVKDAPYTVFLRTRDGSDFSLMGAENLIPSPFGGNQPFVPKINTNRTLHKSIHITTELDADFDVLAQEGLEEDTELRFASLQDALDKCALNGGGTVGVVGNHPAGATLPSTVDIHLIGIKNASIGDLTTWTSGSTKGLYQSSSSSTSKYTVENIKFINIPDYGIRSKSSREFNIINNEFINCGQDGSTVDPDNIAQSGLLGTDSTQSELAASYGSSGFGGGTFRIQDSKRGVVKGNKIGTPDTPSDASFRGMRFQDCGIGGGYEVHGNFLHYTAEASIYLASSTYTESKGCENFNVYNNYVYGAAHSPILIIGGVNNKDWNNTYTKCWAYPAYWNVSEVQSENVINGCGIQTHTFIGAAVESHLMGAGQRAGTKYILRNHNTIINPKGLKEGLEIAPNVGDTLQDKVNAIVELSMNIEGCDIAIKQTGNNPYLTIIRKGNVFNNNLVNVQAPVDADHVMSSNDIHATLNSLNVKSNGGALSLYEGVGGYIIDTHQVKELQAEANDTKIRIRVKDSRVILHDNIPVGNCTINGVLVNGELSTAVTELNSVFSQTSNFMYGEGNPVVSGSVVGDTLILTLSDSTSISIDVTTLNVSSSTSVVSGVVSGDDLILTMNDTSTVVIDVRTLSTGHNPTYPSPNWYYAFGDQQDVVLSNNKFYNTRKHDHPAYFGSSLEKGKEMVWTYNGNGNLHIGIWAGATNQAEGQTSAEVDNWSLKYLFRSVSNGSKVDFEDATNNSGARGTDINTRYATGYALVAGSTQLAIRYMDNDKLGLFDITDGANILISQSNDTYSGAVTFHATGQAVSVQTTLPFWVKREDVYEFAHRGTVNSDGTGGLDADWRDGTEQRTILKTISTFGVGQKMRWNINYTGSNQRWGLGYTGAATGETDPIVLLTDDFRYGATEAFYSMPDWNLNTNAVYYDAALPSYGQNGVPMGEVEIRYLDANTITLWSVANSEKIATLNRDPLGVDQVIYFGRNQYDTSLSSLPIITRMEMNPSTSNSDHRPDLSNQDLNTTEGASVYYVIQKDTDSDAVTMYAASDLPSWLVLNQSTGLILGTAPAWTGTSGSGITNDTVVTIKAANPFGIETFTLTVKVGEDSQSTNWTKAYQFDSTSDHIKQSGNSDHNNPLRKAVAKTAGQPWQISTVFKYEQESANNTIFSQATGATSTDVGVTCFIDSNDKLRFQHGKTTDAVKFVSTDDVSITDYVGLHISYDGLALDATTLNNAGETGADRFSINYVDLVTGVLTPVSGVWTISGSGSDVNVNGDFFIGTWYTTGHVFKGYIASMVVSTMTVGYTPDTNEIVEMVKDPMGWANDYRVGEDWRKPDETSTRVDWQFDHTDPNNGSHATKIWLLGDGTNDIFPYVYDQTCNTINTQRAIANNMDASQVVNVTITGLSN